MYELIKNLINHQDIVVHVAGWGITVGIALITMLHKGVHKRITLFEQRQDQIAQNLDRLIGAHNATHANGEIIERREDPARVTIANYNYEDEDA